jgi:GNAT superfamily N-acetyltransferase
LEGTILQLRTALFDERGQDKNVTLGIAPSFLVYQKNGLNINIEFSPKLSEDDAEWAFEITRQNMEQRYDASGYGWDDDDKERELTEDGARFLLLRDANDCDKLIGYAHFRFTVQGEVIDAMAGDSCLFLVDLHLEEPYQRKGLGKHMMVLLELLARREKMSRVSTPIYLGDEATKQWLTDSVKRGYVLDESCALFGFDADMEGFEVWSKVFPVTASAPAAVPVAVSSSSSASNTSTITQSTPASTAEEEKLTSIFTKATDLAAGSDD